MPTDPKLTPEVLAELRKRLRRLKEFGRRPVTMNGVLAMVWRRVISLDLDTCQSLLDERDALAADLEHMRSDAGADSCADYAVRGRKAERERDALREALEWIAADPDAPNIREVALRALGRNPNEGSSDD